MTGPKGDGSYCGFQRGKSPTEAPRLCYAGVFCVCVCVRGEGTGGFIIISKYNLFFILYLCFCEDTCQQKMSFPLCIAKAIFCLPSE